MLSSLPQLQAAEQHARRVTAVCWVALQQAAAEKQRADNAVARLADFERLQAMIRQVKHSSKPCVWLSACI